MVMIVLVRHGQSIWNNENRFTGWVDVSLSKNGIEEAQKAAKKLENYKFDLAFSSRLMRAQETLYYILDNNKHCNKNLRIHEKNRRYSHYTHTSEDDSELKIYISEKLNERYYGNLQGKNKDAVREEFGEEQVKLWRRSFKSKPPKGESLKDTFNRVVPYYRDLILPQIKNGKNILISAHGNSLRALMMSLENLSGDESMQLELPTGSPIVYHLDENSKYLKINKKVIL